MGNELSAFQKFINTSIEFIANYSFEAVGSLTVLIVGHLVSGISYFEIARKP